jgi:hypothetical protein
MFQLAESGSSLLYIVLGIIYVLYNLYSAAQKNKNKQQNIPYPENKDFEPDDFEEVVIKNPKYEYQKFEKMQTDYNKTKTKSKKPAREHLASPLHSRNISKKPILLKEEVEISEPMISGLSAKNAIIASEILKRPEY